MTHHTITIDVGQREFEFDAGKITRMELAGARRPWPMLRIDPDHMTQHVKEMGTHMRGTPTQWARYPDGRVVFWPASMHCYTLNIYTEDEDHDRSARDAAPRDAAAAEVSPNQDYRRRASRLAYQLR